MSSTNTEFNNDLTINKPYDEEVWIEEATSEHLEDASNIEREYEDAYDAAFTNLMVEKFPHITNTNYISSLDSDTKKSDVFVFRPETLPKNNSETSHDSHNRSSDTNSSNNTINIGDGTFKYVSNKWDREMFVNAWQAITKTNTWDFVKQDIGSFMFSRDPRIDIISEKMIELGYNLHSGTTFGRTMRNMQYLAKFGEDRFKEWLNIVPSVEQIYNKEENISDSDVKAKPYKHEYTMEYKRSREFRDKLMDYMGGY